MTCLEVGKSCNHPFCKKNENQGCCQPAMWSTVIIQSQRHKLALLVAPFMIENKMLILGHMEIRWSDSFIFRVTQVQAKAWRISSPSWRSSPSWKTEWTRFCWRTPPCRSRSSPACGLFATPPRPAWSCKWWNGLTIRVNCCRVFLQSVSMWSSEQRSPTGTRLEIERITGVC